MYLVCRIISVFVFFHDTATTEIYTLSLHDALPIGGPALPVAQQGLELRHVVTVAAQELARTGRRARACVEERDVDLAAREALVEHGKVAHHEGEEAEAHARLDDRERAREGPDGSDIADAQREERGPAPVEICPEG